MTKQCRYYLRCCRKLGEGDFKYNVKDDHIRNVHKISGGIEVKKYISEHESVFDFLLENGYLKRTQFGYDLTQKGLHPKRMIWEKLRAFLIKSVLIPIIVSAVTSVITLYISQLL